MTTQEVTVATLEELDALLERMRESFGDRLKQRIGAGVINAANAAAAYQDYVEHISRGFESARDVLRTGVAVTVTVKSN